MLWRYFFMRLFIKYLILFSIGGIAYFLGEIMWRGWSHWSMFVLGGICFVLIGVINEFMSYDTPLIIQMVIGTFIITVLEFIAGCILNIYLDMGIWSYANMPMNLLGQVCIPYMLGWFFLSLACIVLDDYLRYFIFDEEKPQYRLF